MQVYLRNEDRAWTVHGFGPYPPQKKSVAPFPDTQILWFDEESEQTYEFNSNQYSCVQILGVWQKIQIKSGLIAHALIDDYKR